MPRPWLAQAILDAVFLSAAVFGILIEIYSRLDIGELDESLVLALVSVCVNGVLLYALGSYRRDTLVDQLVATSRLPVAVGCSAFLVFLVLQLGFPFLFPHARVFLSVSRCATISLVVAGASLGALLVSRKIFFAMLRRNWFQRRVLVIGDGRRAEHLIALMRESDQEALAQLTVVNDKVLAGQKAEVNAFDRSDEPPDFATSLEELARNRSIDEIVVAVDEVAGLSFADLLACKVRGLPVTQYHAFIERETGRIDLRWLDTSWLVYSNGFRMNVIDQFLKRAFDILLSLVLLLIGLPVLACAMIAVWLQRDGPIFYRQERVTKDSRIFWLYKLRTMRVDAEKDGAQWADAESDARVTPVGAFLRRTRIDEIPQLFNILRGEMSLVGPRPERPIFVEELSASVRLYGLRHGVKTGLTGWAQINYRYGSSVDDAGRKLEYDLYYLKNCNWLRDLAIIAQTMRILIWPNSV